MIQKKLNKKTIALQIFILLLIAIIGLSLINHYLVPNELGHIDWDEFYALKNNTLDVVVIGSSEAYMTFNPVIMNELTDTDCYILSSDGMVLEEAYFTIVEMLKTQKPKVLAIEMLSFAPYDVENYSYNAVHRVFDNMRLSPNKVKGVFYNIKDEKRLEFILPIKTYHIRWKDMIKNLRNKDTYESDRIAQTRFYGFVAGMTVLEDSLDFENYKNPEEYIIDEDAMKSDRIDMLDKITKLCDENDIQLIYVKSPYVRSDNYSYEKMQTRINALSSYAEKNDIEIVNYLAKFDDIELQAMDFFDEVHLNIYGAEKVSTDFAHHIKENYSEYLQECSIDYPDEHIKQYAKYQNLIDVFNEQNSEYFLH